MDNLDLLYKNLESQHDTYYGLLDLQNNILNSLSASGSLFELDRLLKDEQAFVLKVRSLEQQRLNIVTNMGFGGSTLKQIIEKLNEDNKTKFSLMYEKLASVLKQIKTLNKNSKTIIESKLGALETVSNSKTYSKAGNIPASSDMKYRYNQKI